jgi:hypothetical protein
MQLTAECLRGTCGGQKPLCFSSGSRLEIEGVKNRWFKSTYFDNHEKWRIEEGWILCRNDGLQCSINCPEIKWGSTSI